MNWDAWSSMAKSNHARVNISFKLTVQSVLPLMKKPASSRSPTRSQTSFLVTQWRAVIAPVCPLRVLIFVWVFFCAADMSGLPVVETVLASSEIIPRYYIIRSIILRSSDGCRWKLTCSVERAGP